MLASKKILMKKYFFILSVIMLAVFLLPIKISAVTNYFPVTPEAKNAIGLKLSASFDLEKSQVNLKISTKNKKTKLETISLVVDRNGPIRLTPASSTSFWLDLNSGDRLLTVSVADTEGYLEQATSSVFVPHLQAPYVDFYPLTVYRGRPFVIGGQTLYPSKQVVVHLSAGEEEKTFIVPTDPAGRFNWSGKLSDQGEIKIWAEVLDGSLRSQPSNPIKLRVTKIFSSQWFFNLYASAESYFILRLTVAILLLIFLITFLLHLWKRDKKDLAELDQERLLVTTNSLRQDVLDHIDMMAEIKNLSRADSLPVLLDLQRTVEIVNKYLQTQIKSLAKKKIRRQKRI